MAKIDVPQVASSVEASKLPKASSGKAVKTFLVGLGVTMFAGLVVYPLDTIRRHQMLTGADARADMMLHLTVEWRE